MAPWSTRADVHFYVQKVTGGVVDITPYVRTVGRAAPASAASGRQTELIRSAEPGRLAFVLDNSTGAFTPGRSGASIQLTLGMPVWMTETLGYRTFEIFSGFLELPDVVEQLEGVDNLITVTAVDRKQLLDNGRTFISTLAEHIMYEGRNTLRAYYPLNETAGEPQFGGRVGTEPPLSVDNPKLVALAAQAMAPGDDLSVPVFSDAPVTASTVTDVAQGAWETANFINFTSSETVTIVAWIRPAVPAALVLVDAFQFDGGGSLFFGVDWTLGAPKWNFGATVAGWGPIAGVTTNTGPNVDVWTLVAWRFKLQDQQEIWINRTVETLSFGGGAPASSNITRLSLSPFSRWAGSIAHLQVHVSNGSDDYTYARHLAQLEIGHEGMVYDRTDERIATIISYASPYVTIPTVLDEGTTFMRRASLAGKKPGQAIDEAVDTERGRFVVTGDGVARFHNRIRTHYNL